MTGKLIRKALALLASLAVMCASAHEFWLVPDRFDAPAGAPVRLSMFVGENFTGERIGFYQALVANAHDYSRAGDVDLAPRIPAQPAADLPLRLADANQHLFAIDSHPTQISLPPDKFHAYLHDEGLDFVIRAREAAGQAATPGRERYRRNIKTLVGAGEAGDPTYSRVVGQRLEIVPLANPLRLAPGQDLPLQVLFEGKPLGDALVKLWHKRTGQLLLIRTRTDAQGNATVTPPWPGVWMASVVHMVPATDSREVDWDSLWANLTFAVPLSAAAIH